MASLKLSGISAKFANFSQLVLSIAMIWLAHIGFDRALGYGLRYFVLRLPILGRSGGRQSEF